MQSARNAAIAASTPVNGTAPGRQAAPARPSGRRLLGQTAASWFTIVVEIASGFLLAPIVLRAVGAEQYGVWVILNSTHTMFALLDLGLRGTLNREVAMAHGTARSHPVAGAILRYLLLAATLAAIGQVGVGLAFPSLFPKAAEVPLSVTAGGLALLSLSLYAAFVSSVRTAFLAARGRVHEATLANGAGLLLRLALVPLVVSVQPSLIALAALTTAINWAVAGAIAWRAWRLVRLRSLMRRAGGLAVLARVRGHASFSFAARSIATGQSELPMYATMLLYGPASVAVMSFCFLLVSFSRRLIEAFGANVFPVVMQACAADDRAALRSLYESYLLYTSVLASLLYFGIAFYGGDFLRLWMAPHAFELDTALQVLALGSLLAGLGGFAPIVLEGYGRYWRNLAVFCTELALALAMLAALTFGLGWRENAIAVAAIAPRVLMTGVFLRWMSQAIDLSGARLLRLLRINAGWWLAAAAIVGGWHRLLPPADWLRLLLSSAAAAATFLLLVAAMHGRALLSRLRPPR